MKIGYIMSRFPKLTETFIVNEVSALLDKGIEANLYPINKESYTSIQPRAKALLPRVFFTPLFSSGIFFANLKFALRHPVKYFSVWLKVLFSNISSLNFLLGAVAYYPKAVYLSQLCVEHKITHLHAHFANHPTMIAYVINKLVGIPYSFTAHGSDLHKRQSMLAEKCRCAEFVVMISQYNIDFVGRKVGVSATKNMQLVRCGIDASQFVYHDKDGISQPVNILCVAALREVKGHKYLIEAASILKQRNVFFKMNFVGEGPKRDILEEMIAANGLEKEVLLCGGKTQDEVADLMRQADIFTLASYKTRSGNREGIPVVLMEAMATGTPVVASDVSGIPELVINEQTGLLAEPQNARDFADKLSLLIENSQLAHELTQKARQHVQQEFDLQGNVEKLVRLFNHYQPK